MTADNGPVHDHEQKPRTHKRGKERNDAEVPHLVGLHACHVRRALREPEREQHAERGHGAVSRNENGADVEEDWMHWGKNIFSGHGKGRIRPTGP